MAAVPRVPALASVVTLAVGALVAAGIFAASFLLEGQSRDAAHALERQTAMVAAASRLGRSVEIMMTILLALKPGVSDELAEQHVRSRRDFDAALERVKRLASDEGDEGLETRASAIAALIDGWQRQVTVPLLQRRQQAAPPRPSRAQAKPPAPAAAPYDDAGQAGKIRDNVRDLEDYAREGLAARRSDVERLARRERLLGRSVAAATALGLLAACVLRWRASRPGALS
jgi:hypothetical protein